MMLLLWLMADHRISTLLIRLFKEQRLMLLGKRSILILQLGVILQVQFLLKPAYTDGRTGERFRAINYLADFTHWQMEDGEWKFHIADSKGHITKEYALKKKIMADMGHYIEEV